MGRDLLSYTDSRKGEKEHRKQAETKVKGSKEKETLRT